MNHSLVKIWGGVWVVALALILGPRDAKAQVTAPYLENFETEIQCPTGCGPTCNLLSPDWSNLGPDLDWTSDVGGTGSSGTGPDVDHTLGTAAGHYLYIESSCSGTGYPNFAGTVQSALLDLTAATNPAVRFWYHMLGSTTMELHADVVDAAGTTVLLADAFTVTGNQGNQWVQTPVIDLSAYVGQQVRIQIRGITGTSFDSDMAIDDFELIEVFDNDVGVVGASVTEAGCVGAITLDVTIENFGALPQSNVPVQFVLNGGAAVVETYVGPIAAFATDSFTFTATPMVVEGVNTLDISTALATDQDATNDGISVSSTGVQPPPALPAIENFDGLVNWTVDNPTGGNFELGTPADAVIQGTTSGANAWVTGLNSNYPGNMDQSVQMTCGYDLMNATTPAVRMSVWWNSEFSWDGAALQSSIDGGLTWQNVGANGDPNNWYNDNTINGAPGGQQEGWTGRNSTNNGSGGWVTAVHELTGLAGTTDARLRVAFGSDGAVHDEGFAFDDVLVFDNVDGLIGIDASPAATFTTVTAGDTDVLVHSFKLFASGVAQQDVNSITLTLTGGAADADIANVNLWIDDGDGAFDALVDTSLGTGTFTNGALTITTMGNLAVAAFTDQQLWVSFDVAAAATVGTQFGSSVAANGDVVIASMDPVTLSGTLAGPLYAVSGLITGPLFDGFADDPGNRSVESGTGIQYPEAAVAGDIAALGTATANDATVSILGAYYSNGVTIAPTSANAMAAIGFPNGAAVGALEYSLDLSAYSTTEPIWLAFDWNNTNEEDDLSDNVFISVDGGTTWLSLYNWDFSAPVATGWNSEVVDVSAALTTASLMYSNDVRLRFQAGGASALGDDGLFIDSVFLGRPQWAAVERMMADVADGGTDDLTMVPTAPQSLMYLIRNDGDLDLTLDLMSFASSNDTNVANVTITAPMGDVVPAGGSAMVQVDFEISAPGAFSFDVEFISDDPRLGDTIYNWTISGTGDPYPAPEIDVSRGGSVIASGGMDDLGALMGATTVTYTIDNVGDADLSVTGATVNNAVGATVNVTSAPGMTVAANGSTTVELSVTPSAATFSFELSIGNDDSDENPYTISVNGTDGGTGVGGGGATGTGGGATTGTGGGGDPEEDGGCSCSTPGQSGGDEPFALIALAGLGLVINRRRRR